MVRVHATHHPRAHLVESRAVTTFAGRDAERQVMADALAAARRGQPTVLHVVGEPGIGKTRLLEVFHADAQAAGFTVVSSRGTEFDREVPYGVLTELVQELSDLRRQAAGRTAADCADDTGTVERYRRHRVVRDALEAASRTRPMVVTLDDAQWADDSSLDCWSHLIRRPPRGELVLVPAHRAVPLPANLEASLSDAHRAGTGRRVELPPLGFADAVALIGPGRGPSWRRAVYEAGGGNPLYLESLVKTAHPAADTALLPPTIRAALRAEVDVLDDATRLAA
ncbi:ATP-binding protein [Saccharothrix sp. S26]|uniref:AAA family ATPase n=1 Tax=Saccharothrix sp. S26 TaxID=2907215 RepID=UPI001F2DF9DE|nr:AAA family ATPase [Saccharothrix sp. S26]MCE6998111.1 ATP-binding protein [Saccharothrix sp. S26]